MSNMAGRHLVPLDTVCAILVGVVAHGGRKQHAARLLALAENLSVLGLAKDLTL